MTRISSRYLICGGILGGMWMLASCAATKVTSVTKDPSFNAKSMHRVLVMAVVHKPSVQRLLEDQFVRNLKKRGSDGVASYTLVTGGTKLDEQAWRKLVSDQHCDSVIISRVVDIQVLEKDVESKYVQNPNAVGNYGGYGYYSQSYGYVYQPAFTVREETAAIETEVFNAAGEKPLWSAHSKTTIEQESDPEPQVRGFVDHMMDQIYR